MTLAVLAGVPAGIASYERSRAPSGARIVELTGVMKDGVWTDERVTSANYWHRTYRRATVEMRVGEEVLLRLSSADVTHGFYAPELGLGPVDVEPGHVVELRVKAERPGEFTYYCTAVCGKCHHFMRGIIRVLGDGPAATPAVAAADPSCPHHAPAAQFHTLAERGDHLFQTVGCVNCHGQGGRGGVVNPNYVKDTVPALDAMAERMMLFDRTEADLVIGLLERRADLEALAENPPLPRYAGFLAQYNAVRNLIRNGNPAARKDPAGPAPPLHMPAWGEHLSPEETDALIAYLIRQYPWDEEEEDP